MTKYNATAYITTVSISCRNTNRISLRKWSPSQANESMLFNAILGEFSEGQGQVLQHVWVANGGRLQLSKYEWDI